MSIQFAGSKSLDDRRRRRLVVNADGTGADGTSAEDNPSAGKVLSELVASAAAAPWVPVYEWRLWTYTALIGLVVSAAAFALARPLSFRPELAPLTKHLLEGDRPVLAVFIQTTFCFLATQLALLIGWYRAQCKLDFRGHYRVWAWTAVWFAIASFCSATHLHVLLGQLVEKASLVPWRPRVVTWLLPTSFVALPLFLLLDRDVRRGRSSLYTLRVAWLLTFVCGALELFSEDLQRFTWVPAVRVILPLFATGTMFVGFWLHARVVAYISPDPPEPVPAPARSWLAAAWAWMSARLTWRRTQAAAAESETKSKPRGRRKAAEDDDATPKRKRRAPAKRKPRRTKAAEVEEEEAAEDEEQEEAYDDGAEASEGYEMEPEEPDVEEPEEEPAPPVRSGRDRNSRGSGISNPAPANPGRNEQSASDEDSEEDSDGDEDDDTQMRRDSGIGPDQLKGLSKRQKRELRRQSRDQQRNNQRN